MEQFSESFDNLVDKLQSWLDAIIVGLPNFVLAIVILAMGIFLSRFVKKYVSKLLNRLKLSQSIVNLLANIITGGFIILVLFVVLGILNLEKTLTSLLAGAGVLGLAVGLALQEPLINTFSGIMMSVRDMYRIGDYVETNGYRGIIQDINLRTTIVKDLNGQEIVIPNKHVVQNPLVNYTESGQRRVVIECGVAYGDDLKKVKEVAIKAIEDGLDYNKDKDVELYYNSFGDSSINFVLRFWLKSTAQRPYLQAQSDAIIALKAAFDENEITIPFPIRTLDFGVVGGVNIDDIYKPEKIFSNDKNQEQNTTNGRSETAVES